jgi:hypothetical protein
MSIYVINQRYNKGVLDRKVVTTMLMIVYVKGQWYVCHFNAKLDHLIAIQI